MTQAIDLMAVEALALVQELKQHLHERFQIAVRIRKIGDGKGIACTRYNRAAIGIWWMYDQFQVPLGATDRAGAGTGARGTDW